MIRMDLVYQAMRKHALFERRVRETFGVGSNQICNLLRNNPDNVELYCNIAKEVELTLEEAEHLEKYELSQNNLTYEEIKHAIEKAIGKGHRVVIDVEYKNKPGKGYYYKPEAYKKIDLPNVSRLTVSAENLNGHLNFSAVLKEREVFK